MKMNCKLCPQKELGSWLILAAAFVLSALTYQYLPDNVASHWNFAGQVDGWCSRSFHAFFFPGLLLFMYILFLIVPTIDPKKNNYEKFAPTFNLYRTLILFTLFIVYAATTLFNLGQPINISQVVSFVIGLLMIIIGLTLKNLENNWFVGIRTPWTISSETVWKKTHRVGGYSFFIFGAIIMGLPYLKPLGAGILFLTGLLIVIGGNIIYSYIVYQQEQNKTQKIKATPKAKIKPKTKKK